jgi:tight adherence protein B
MPLLIAALIFLGVMATVVGVWLTATSRRQLRERLGDAAKVSDELKSVLREAAQRHSRNPLQRLERLASQAGTTGGTRLQAAVAGLALAGAAVGWLRLGSVPWGALLAAAAGSLPIFYLLYRKMRRLQRFEAQFAEALDMMSRSLRAGYALAGAVQLVGEEMPEPTAEEFKRVTEEIRLGIDPGEALFRLQQRVPTQDTVFFCTAIRIQRSAGGNLAEILDRLAEVVRERFKVLSQARALSAQHRWAAIMVGLSPLAFSIMFQILQPGYFDALLQSPTGPKLITAGLIMEAIGFFMVWRIAKIEV